MIPYNPLAGGLLTGKHTHDMLSASAGAGGRFDNNEFCKDRYWKRELFAALDAVRATCEEQGEVGMAEAAIR